MKTDLKYGIHSTQRLEIADEHLIADLTQPATELQADVAGIVDAALAAPLDFPPLESAAVPGDRVVVALGEDVPAAATIVTGIITTLTTAGVLLEDILVLLSAQCDEGVRQTLAEAMPELQLKTHDPEDRENLAYLAAAENAKPIYVNRELIDADLVIPIGCLKLAETLGHTGVTETLFPLFADLDAQRRYLAPNSTDSPVLLEKRQKEAIEANWLLGLQLTVQVVPGEGDSLSQIFCGQFDAVERAGQQACVATWKRPIRQRASLALAAVSGPAASQTWLNFARAMYAACQAVEEDGAIAICMDLEGPIGPALRYLIDAAHLDEALHEIRKERSPDAIAAAELARVLQQTRVYLLSNMNSRIVESLGIAPIDSAEELQRLVSAHASCILIGNAQHAMPCELA
jgi:nickel-dependent lactate racemase